MALVKHSRSSCCCCFFGSQLGDGWLGDSPNHRQQWSSAGLCRPTTVTDLWHLLWPQHPHGQWGPAVGTSWNSHHQKRVTALAFLTIPVVTPSSPTRRWQEGRREICFCSGPRPGWDLHVGSSPSCSSRRLSGPHGRSSASPSHWNLHPVCLCYHEPRVGSSQRLLNEEIDDTDSSLVLDQNHFIAQVNTFYTSTIVTRAISSGLVALWMPVHGCCSPGSFAAGCVKTAYLLRTAKGGKRCADPSGSWESAVLSQVTRFPTSAPFLFSQTLLMIRADIIRPSAFYDFLRGPHKLQY